jgi:hypothetical protein
MVCRVNQDSFWARVQTQALSIIGLYASFVPSRGDPGDRHGTRHKDDAAVPDEEICIVSD